MPITKSAIKALKQSESRRARNAIVKKNLKSAVRITDNKKFSRSQSVIDKATKTGYIHKNKAARLKSRLAKKIASK